MSQHNLKPSIPAFEIKGSLFPLMEIHVFTNRCEEIADQLAQKVMQAPNFFRNAPVVIELRAVQRSGIDLDCLVETLRMNGLIPVGVRGGGPQQNNSAVRLNIGIMPESNSNRREKKNRELVETKRPSRDKIVSQPVRSGQQVVSLEGDIIILSSVSPGAEVLAQRHIHVYGALRGRALAGVNGDVEARIFCQYLDAELISIAGHYQINESLDDSLRGKPAQIYLQEDVLKVESLAPIPR